MASSSENCCGVCYNFFYSLWIRPLNDLRNCASVTDYISQNTFDHNYSTYETSNSTSECSELKAPVHKVKLSAKSISKRRPYTKNFRSIHKRSEWRSPQFKSRRGLTPFAVSWITFYDNLTRYNEAVSRGQYSLAVELKTMDNVNHAHTEEGFETFDKSLFAISRFAEHGLVHVLAVRW